MIHSELNEAEGVAVIRPEQMHGLSEADFRQLSYCVREISGLGGFSSFYLPHQIHPKPPQSDTEGCACERQPTSIRCAIPCRSFHEC